MKIRYTVPLWKICSPVLTELQKFQTSLLSHYNEAYNISSWRFNQYMNTMKKLLKILWSHTRAFFQILNQSYKKMPIIWKNCHTFGSFHLFFPFPPLCWLPTIFFKFLGDIYPESSGGVIPLSSQKNNIGVKSHSSGPWAKIIFNHVTCIFFFSKTYILNWTGGVTPLSLLEYKAKATFACSWNTGPYNELVRTINPSRDKGVTTILSDVLIEHC